MVLYLQKHKKLDVLKHFKRIILREIKPLSTLLAEQVSYLGTFSHVIPDMLGYSIVSIVNKVNLLRRLEDNERVEKEIIREVLSAINEIEVYMSSSEVPLGLKAYGLSTVVVSRILFEEYAKGVDLFRDVVAIVNKIDNAVKRSVVLSDVLFSLGMIRRYTRRGTQEIPGEVLDSLASMISDTVQRIISETNFITDPYARGRIFANIGFGTRLFSVISREEIMAQWYDINQSQSLALDALNEAEKIGDWYKRGLIISDAATVLAISGDDTVSLASEKFDEATELAFKYLNKNPLKAASLLGRIAYDKAFTRFYMDSDKFFYESIIIPLEAASLNDAFPLIMKILWLASKARYFYVIYEIVKDCLLPLIDREKDVIQKARFLAMCSAITIPVSINWSRNIANEALSLVKSFVDSEVLPIYYEPSLIGDPLSYTLNIMSVASVISHAAYSMPKESVSIFNRVLTIADRLLSTYTRYFRRRAKYSLVDKIAEFNKKLGFIISSLKKTPRLYKDAMNLGDKFVYNVRQIIARIYGVDSLEHIMTYLSFLYGLSHRRNKDVIKPINNIIHDLFKYENNMWCLKREEIIKMIGKDKNTFGLFVEILKIVSEIAYNLNQSLKETIIKILIDLSEAMDQKTYTSLLTALVEKIENRDIVKVLISNVFNILIDEGRISKSVMPKKLYRVINNIDPMLARFILEEIS